MSVSSRNSTPAPDPNAMEYEYDTPSTLRNASEPPGSAVSQASSTAVHESQAEQAIRQFRTQYPSFFTPEQLAQFEQESEEDVEAPESREQSPTSPYDRDPRNWTPRQAAAYERVQYENDQVRILYMMHNGTAGDEIFGPARSPRRPIRWQSEEPELGRTTPTPYGGSIPTQEHPELMDVEESPSPGFDPYSGRMDWGDPETRSRGGPAVQIFDDSDDDATPRQPHTQAPGGSRFGGDWASNRNVAPPRPQFFLHVPNYGLCTADEAIALVHELRGRQEQRQEQRENDRQDRAERRLRVQKRLQDMESYREQEAKYQELRAKIPDLQATLHRAMQEWEQASPDVHARYLKHTDNVDKALVQFPDSGHIISAAKWFSEIDVDVWYALDGLASLCYDIDLYDFYRLKSFYSAAAVEFRENQFEVWRLESDEGAFGYEIVETSPWEISQGNNCLAFSMFGPVAESEDDENFSIAFVEANLEIRIERVIASQHAIQDGLATPEDRVVLRAFKAWALDALDFVRFNGHHMDISSEFSEEEQEAWCDLQWKFQDRIKEIFAVTAEEDEKWDKEGRNPHWNVLTKQVCEYDFVFSEVEAEGAESVDQNPEEGAEDDSDNDTVPAAEEDGNDDSSEEEEDEVQRTSRGRKSRL